PHASDASITRNRKRPSVARSILRHRAKLVDSKRAQSSSHTDLLENDWPWRVELDECCCNEQQWPTDNEPRRSYSAIQYTFHHRRYSPMRSLMTATTC